MNSILTPVRHWAARCPEKLLFAFLDRGGRITQSYTYSAFMGRTTDIASHLRRAHPMPRGSRVLLAYSPGLEMICAFFACVRLGLIPVPVCPAGGQGGQATCDRINLIAADCGASGVLTDKRPLRLSGSDALRSGVAARPLPGEGVFGLPWIKSTDADRNVSRDFDEAHSEVLFLQYTSGSTSEPRGVVVTHANILHNCNIVVDHLPVGVSWLPQYHDMGLIGYYLFFALKGGTTYGFSPADFIQRPALWLETISRHRGTASSAPNFAYEYCLRPGKIPPEVEARLDLSSLRFLMTAAEPVDAQAYRDFIRRFESRGLNPRNFFSAYGLAENTLAVSNYGRTIQRFEREALNRHVVNKASHRIDPADAKTLVSCGKPLPGNEVRIVDVAGAAREAEPGRVGEIWLRGASKCKGYWNRPELTSTVFQASLPGENTDCAWLRTGDLGFLDGGELYVCGRSKDLIIARGRNCYPQDIECVVGEHADVRNGCVAAFTLERDAREQLVVVARVRDPKRLPDAGELRGRVLRRAGIAVDVFAFIHGCNIARTSSGKIARHQVRRQFEAGELRIVSLVRLGAPIEGEPEPGPAAPRPAGHNAFEAILEKFGLTGDEPCTLLDAGLDSIRRVELCEQLKAHLCEQGHEQLAGLVDLRVLQKIAIRELYDLLVQLSAAAPRAIERFEKVLTDLRREHHELETVMMRRDSRPCFDPTHLPACNAKSSPAPHGVLLTGGTGFFGPFLLASLLAQTDDPIYVLVRADSEMEGRQRLLAGLRALAPAKTLPGTWERRIRPVCGDLGRKNLGLSDEKWNALAAGVHDIYHNGAQVNYLLDYASLRDVNVGGTKELVRLALSHHAKVFNHISTTFVFGWSVKDVLYESDNNAGMDLLDFGYSQSKWVSEQLVLDAMQHGGLRARIFRPALITPSLDGGGCNLDISIRLLAFMLNHGIGTDARNQVSFSPAELTAENIVAISRSPDSIGRTFHVTRDTYTNMVEITRILGELTGTRFENFNIADFVPEVIERCGPGDVLFPLLDFFVRSAANITAMEFKRYDNSHYARARDASTHGRKDPPLRDVVLGILRYMRRQGVVSI